MRGRSKQGYLHVKGKFHLNFQRAIVDFKAPVHELLQINVPLLLEVQYIKKTLSNNTWQSRILKG